MIKIKGNLKKFISFITCLLILISVNSNVFARELIDTNRKTTLEVEYLKTAGVNGVKFDVYKIADVDKYGRFTILPKFSSYGLSLDKHNKAEWLDMASTISAYIARDNIRPTKSATTNSSSVAKFEQLDVGMYLILGKQVTHGNKKYTQIPFLLSLPNMVADKWSYDVKTYSKYTSEDSNIWYYVDRKVLKVWEDEGHEDERPQSVEVQLLKDGVVYSTVELNESNSWRYRWDNLSSEYTWTVVEKEVPQNYKLSIKRRGITFKLINTYDETHSTTTTTTSGGNGTTTTTTDGGNGTTTTTRGGDDITVTTTTTDGGNGTTTTTTDGGNGTTTTTRGGDDITVTTTTGGDSTTTTTTGGGNGITTTTRGGGDVTVTTTTGGGNGTTTTTGGDDGKITTTTDGDDGFITATDDSGVITTTVTTGFDDDITDDKIPEGGGLPQTGMLWWPVPILLGSSIIMFVLGIIKNRFGTR